MCSAREGYNEIVEILLRQVDNKNVLKAFIIFHI